jgi:hypothetical protein
MHEILTQIDYLQVIVDDFKERQENYEEMEHKTQLESMRYFHNGEVIGIQFAISYLESRITDLKERAIKIDREMYTEYMDKK